MKENGIRSEKLDFSKSGHRNLQSIKRSTNSTIIHCNINQPIDSNKQSINSTYIHSKQPKIQTINQRDQPIPTSIQTINQLFPWPLQTNYQTIQGNYPLNHKFLEEKNRKNICEEFLVLGLFIFLRRFIVLGDPTLLHIGFNKWACVDRYRFHRMVELLQKTNHRL